MNLPIFLDMEKLIDVNSTKLTVEEEIKFL